jgi:hypothetical protein
VPSTGADPASVFISGVIVGAAGSLVAAFVWNEFLVPLVRTVMRRLGRWDDPRIVIHANPPDLRKASERACLDWPHFGVQNVGLSKAKRTRPAHQAVATLRVEWGQNFVKPFMMLWDTPAGPSEERRLRRRREETIPFARRHIRSGDEDPHPITARPDGLYYITDALFLTQGTAHPPFVLPTGPFKMRLTILYEDGREASQWFEGAAPKADDAGQTLTLRAIDSPREARR